MNDSRETVSYEVLVRRGARWQIHARFGDGQQKDAMDEGRAVRNFPAVVAVKVVKEVYDPDRGTSRDFVLARYGAGGDGDDDTPRADGRRTMSRQPRETEWAEADDRGLGTPLRRGPIGGLTSITRSSPTARRPTTSLGGRLIMMVGGALLAATAFSGMIGMMLGGSFSAETRSQIVFGLFVFMFVISLVALSRLYITPWDSFGKGKKEANDKEERSPLSPWSPEKDKDKSPGEGADGDSAEKKTVALSASLPDEIKARFQAAAKKGIKMADRRYFLHPAVRQRPPKRAAEGASRQALDLMGFLSQAMGSLKGRQGALDQQTLFAANLFLAGACEVLAKKNKVDKGAATTLLVKCIQALGTKKTQADGFGRNYAEYLGDPRYRAMYDAGASAMTGHLDAGVPVAGKLEEALVGWAKPQPSDHPDAPVTVMFTDMVGSTRLAQEQGDVIAQQVIRVHNQVVRHALTKFNGREVKHTGDGIMAAFPMPANAVDAAMAIQLGARDHTTAHPDLPLRVRIGMHSGDAIVENNDLFGTTVQLAARICGIAGPDRIFVHDVVRSLCKDKAFRFVDRGAHQLKGIDGPVTIHEVIWNRGPSQPQPEPEPEPVALVPELGAPSGQAPEVLETTSKPRLPTLSELKSDSEAAPPLDDGGQDMAAASPSGIGADPFRPKQAPVTINSQQPTAVSPVPASVPADGSSAPQRKE